MHRWMAATLVLGLAAGAPLPHATSDAGAGRGPSAPSPGAVGPTAGPAYGTYAWPVRGPVLRPFEAPAGPYGAGHRGIDIGSSPGTVVRAAREGRVAFAGRVAGDRFVSIDHPDGIRTTYSWLSGVRVRSGEGVARGQPIGLSGEGHAGSGSPHLHFGARLGQVYVDPMLLLERGSLVGLIRLAPLEEIEAERSGARRPVPGSA